MGTLKALGPVEELWAETRAQRAVATRGIEQRMFANCRADTRLRTDYEIICR